MPDDEIVIPEPDEPEPAEVVGSSLPAEQRLAAALLASGESAADVAKQLGRSRAEIARWRRSAPFAELVDALLSDATTQAQRTLVANVQRAAEVIAGQLNDGDPLIQRAAAKETLDRAAAMQLCPDHGGLPCPRCAVTAAVPLTEAGARAKLEAYITRLGGRVTWDAPADPPPPGAPRVEFDFTEDRLRARALRAGIREPAVDAMIAERRLALVPPPAPAAAPEPGPSAEPEPAADDPESSPGEAYALWKRLHVDDGRTATREELEGKPRPLRPFTRE